MSESALPQPGSVALTLLSHASWGELTISTALQDPEEVSRSPGDKAKKHEAEGRA